MHTKPQSTAGDVYATANTAFVMVCIDRCENAAICGRIYNVHLKSPLPFRTLDEMLAEMDEVYDLIHYPRASVQYRELQPLDEQGGYEALQHYRSLGNAGNEEALPTMRKENRPYRPEIAEEINYDIFYGCRGKLATFLIHMMYRQNASWQGRVVLVGKRPRGVCFRSALELMYIIRRTVL